MGIVQMVRTILCGLTRERAHDTRILLRMRMRYLSLRQSSLARTLLIRGGKFVGFSRRRRDHAIHLPGETIAQIPFGGLENRCLPFRKFAEAQRARLPTDVLQRALSSARPSQMESLEDRQWTEGRPVPWRRGEVRSRIWETVCPEIHSFFTFPESELFS
jgi:hypothetical protein